MDKSGHVQDLTLLNIIRFFHDKFPESKADMLGKYLGIPPPVIERLTHDSGSDSERLLSEVIDHWLRNDKDQSWSKLADALQYCNYGVLAENIRAMSKRHNPHNTASDDGKRETNRRRNDDPESESNGKINDNAAKNESIGRINDDAMGKSNGKKNCDMKNETNGRMSDSERDGGMNQQQQLENQHTTRVKVGVSTMQKSSSASKKRLLASPPLPVLLPPPAPAWSTSPLKSALFPVLCLDDAKSSSSVSESKSITREFPPATMASVRPISITQAKVEEGELSPPEKDEDEEITAKSDSKGSSIKSVEDSSSSPAADTTEPDIITVMVAGRPRNGKTTALNNMFDLNLEARASAHTVTQCVNVTEVTKKILKNEEGSLYKEVRFEVIDTPGLGGLDIPMRDILEDMKRVTNGKDFILIYCFAVDPNVTLTSVDHTIIQSFNHAWGTDVWRKCVLLFTFSDLALRYFEGSSEQYIKYIIDFARKFQMLLKTVSSELPTVKSIFEFGSQEELQREEMPSGIIVIPVMGAIMGGSEAILPNMIKKGQDWTDVVFIELMKRTFEMERGPYLLFKRWTVNALGSLVNLIKK